MSYMANWTIINEAAVRTGKITLFLDRMQAEATAKSEANPLPEMIADVVATIRSAVSVGNVLDQDTTKIPNSLKGLALRLVNRRIKGYLNQELTSEESKQADDDRSYLNRIVDSRIKFETPDTPAGDAEMQSPGGLVETAQAGDSGNSRAELGRL